MDVIAVLISATAEVIMLLHREVILFFRASSSAMYCAAVANCAGRDATVFWLVAVEATVGVVEAIQIIFDECSLPLAWG